MTDANVKAEILKILEEVAPDAELGELDENADLRDELDIDSMDFLNVVVGIHEALAVEIPEADYPQLVSLQNLVAYVEKKLVAK